MLKKIIGLRNLGIYSIIPILSLAHIPNLFHSTDLLRLITLLIATIVMLYLNKNNFLVKNLLQLVPFLLIIIYLVNEFILKNDITAFLLGRFNRYGGFISLICFAIYFIITSNRNSDSKKYFVNSLYFTYLIMITYGLLDTIGLISNTFYDPNEKIVKLSNDLSLTLGNPNIASAFFGITISVHVIMILFKIFNNYYIQFVILLTSIFLLYQTKSIQGWLIIICNLLVCVFLAFRRNQEKFTFKIKIIFSLLAVFVFISLIANLTRLWQYIFVNGHAEERINYWKSSIRIWKDFIFTGVGLDNLAEFSTFYRDPKLAKQEGTWTIPDRSHNVFFDHLVNGGIFAGITWLFFILVISFLAIQRITRDYKDRSSVYEITVIATWIGYLVQSLISVDHIFLTLIGHLSAALILGDYLNSKTSKVLGKPKIASGLVLTLTIFLIFTINQVRIDYYANQFLKFGNVSALEKIFNNKFIEQQTYLDICVKLGGDKQFKLASAFANKLLEVNPYASQAYYANSVLQESEGNLVAAKSEMEKAHRFDKYNSVYTLSLGIYEFNLKNYPKAQFWLEETINLNPNQQGNEILQRSLADKIN